MTLAHGLSLHDALLGRRSFRVFAPDPVSPELIRAVLEAARWAPSPHHTQPWRFAIVTDPAWKRRLAREMGERWAEDLRADGASPEEIAGRVGRSHQRIAGAPAVVVCCISMRDMHVYPDAARQAAERTMAAQSLGAAIQNVLLAAFAHGLAAGWICAPLFCPEVARAALELPGDWEPQALVLIGYPPRDVPLPPRVKPELIVEFR
jgi:F420 biosynthesis protein FbiB-like protein